MPGTGIFIIAVLSKRTTSALVFAFAFLALSWNVWNAGIASGYIDSVKKLGAQDESVYTREAIHFATRGNWLTMTYLDRFVLFKPPLLMWLSGLSAKLVGISPFGVRLPSLLAGSLVCLLVFLMSRRAGWAAVLLLVSDRLFHTLARVNMTDIILCACLVSAFYWIAKDPSLSQRRSFWGFSISCALAILAKSIAGLLPFGVGLVFILCFRGSAKPRFWRLVQAGLAAVAIALPWHLYQLFAHYQWFLAEYLGVQLLAFGGKPPQTSQENQVVFYLTRLWLSDPVLSIAVFAAIPGWFRSRTEPIAVLLFAWFVVFAGAMMIFQYRSVQYMLPLIPMLALAVAAYCPSLERRSALVVLCAIFVVKGAFPDQTWGNSFASGTNLVLAQPLSEYCKLGRPNDLIILDSTDEFYSSVLPITRIRYGWADPNDSYLLLEPHLRYLGLMLKPSEFLDLPAKTETYRQRLLEWGLTSDRAIGTAIGARSASEFIPIVIARPGSDFLLPSGLIPGEALATHEVRQATDGRVFLISNQPAKETWEGPRWSCRM
jgi:Dolichyl-phosphate-mannose-protein mannosyltransferase